VSLPERPRSLLLPLLLAGATCCAAARADPSPQAKLGAVEKAIEAARQNQSDAAKRADKLAAELQQLRAASVAAAAAAQAHEAALDRIDAQLAALAADEHAKTEALARGRKRETALLMALARLASSPPESFALAPAAPVDALRGALVMGRAVAPLVVEARALKASLAALAAVRSAIEAARAHQRGEQVALDGDRARIDRLIAHKGALRQSATASADAEAKRAQGLAAQAASLRDLIERVEAQHRKVEAARRKAEAAAAAEAERRQAEAARKSAAAPEPRHDTAVAVVAPPPVHPGSGRPPHIRSFAAARGGMVYPVTGTLIRRFGAPDRYGQPSQGLSFAARPGAIVVAPFDGQVLFAGPFRGYGQILIISHGDGYHSLLAGLDRLESSVGQWLVAGEPVGTMSDAADKPRLYLELRHNDQPINPAPWLPTRVEKVNG